ncbi:hypothetical protein IQ07DRAFT_555522 [Pyrenochaeta sp. DS3sAY3a]|nr:hypothetical protein IQ07DRAFT_555522 [Pyrenochaeta sp. DS3sAY3a]
MAALVLPGDTIPHSALPKGTGKKKTLTLGPGLRHIPPNTVVSTVAGALAIDHKKNAASVEFNSGKYTAFPGDLVIATVHSSSAEAFQCFLTPHTATASLPHLAFEGATKKTRPQLAPNSLVYCRIVSCGKDLPAELTCVDPATGKSEGLGLLKGGMLFSVSLGMARRMLSAKGGVVLLELLGAKIGFEVTVGRNGVVLVDGGGVKTTLAVGRALQEVDREGLGEERQRKLAADVLKSL